MAIPNATSAPRRTPSTPTSDAGKATKAEAKKSGGEAKSEPKKAEETKTERPAESKDTRSAAEKEGAKETGRSRMALDGQLQASKLNESLEPKNSHDGEWGPTISQVSEGTSAFHKGQRGEGVRSMQQTLKNAGYDVKVTGKYDEATFAAVQDFKKKNKLPLNGIVDQTTLQKLENQAVDQQLKVNSDTKKEVMDRLRASKDPVERAQLTGLAFSPGFGKLNPDHQKQMLQALDKNPTDPAYANSLTELAGSENFRKLNDEVKSNTIAQMAKHPHDVAARDTIHNLATSPGFGRLSDKDKNTFMRFAGDDSAAYGGRARADLDKLMASKPFKDASPDGQRDQLKTMLNEQKFLPGATTAPAGHFDQPGLRKPYTIHPPTGPATNGVKRYEVEIEGRRIPVLVRDDKPPLKYAPVEQVAKALAATPKASRDLINEVVYEADQRPGAYMAADHTGQVHVYPVTNVASQTFADSAMLHETGHILSQRTYGKTAAEPGWDRWKAAMEKDGVRPSRYAHTSKWPTQDDFAEAWLLYGQVKGTPREAKMRALYPERFKMMDELSRG